MSLYSLLGLLLAMPACLIGVGIYELALWRLRRGGGL